MRIVINIEDGTDETIEVNAQGFAPRGYTNAEMDTAKRESLEQIAADLAERSPEAAKMITTVLEERAKERAARDPRLDVAAEAAIADVEPVK